MEPMHFTDLTDRFRSPHLWGKDADGTWKLRHRVAGDGLDDLLQKSCVDSGRMAV
jgi:hypothetical protein